MVHIRRMKMKINSAWSQSFGRESSHPLDQIKQRVTLGIDGPNDIAHRGYRLTRNSGDRQQWTFDVWASISQLALRYLAQDSNPRQVRTDVVVKVGSDVGAYVRDFNKPCQTIAKQRVKRQRKRQNGERHEPPTPPNRRRNGKSYDRRNATADSIRVNCPHEKSITARRKIRKVH